RLDVMTSGLLLLTTDGAAAHRLMHPRFAVPRTYWLRAHGRPSSEIAAALGSPIAIDGRAVRVTQFRLRPAGRSAELELTLAEGRQRIVRRLAEALGLKVEWLHRVAYGPVRLGRLQEGKYRRLVLQDLLGEPTDDVLQRSLLYQHLLKYKPDAVVDSINTATAFAYQDPIESAQQLLTLATEGQVDRAAVERHVLLLTLPQLI